MKSRVPKNIGGAQNMNSMIKQAQKMQDEITELQNDIEARDFSATSGGGLSLIHIYLLLLFFKISFKYYFYYIKYYIYIIAAKRY